jgi:hypothetical protein
MAKNPGLKRAHETDEYTQEMIMELQKCSVDPIYFMEKYVKVQHPVKGSVPFVLYDYQKEMVMGIHENRSTILLLSRQLGKCFFGSTKLLNIVKPTGFKKYLLKLLDKETYDNLFRPSSTEE